MSEKPSDHYGKNYAWAINISSSLTSAGISKLSSVPLETFPKLRNFIDTVDDTQRILVGLKGTGKTSALARKAAEFAREAQMIPRSAPYLCKLHSISISADENMEYLYKTDYYWSSLWLFVLNSVYCSQYFGDVVIEDKDGNQPFKVINRSFLSLLKINDANVRKDDKVYILFKNLDELSRLGDFKQTNRHLDNALISSILELSIRSKLTKNEIDSWLSIYLYPEMKDILAVRTARSPTGVFIDAIDEAFGTVISYRDSNNILIGHQIWTAIQCGFIRAVIELQNITNDRFRVFGAVREEAYIAYPESHTQDGSQITETCLQMKYSKNLLISIFEKNIENTNSKHLSKNHKSKSNEIDKFFPTNSFEYPFAWGYSESCLQWIIRHTFNIPRHVVWHGRNIIDDISFEDRNNRRKLSKVIHSTALSIFIGYKKQVDWNNKIDDILVKFPSNVISRKEKLRFNNEFDNLGITPFDFLYQRGLIGFPKVIPEDNGRFYQHFPAAGLDENLKLPDDAPYYILHPCLTCYILDMIGTNNFLNKIFITGKGYECPAKIDPKIIIHKLRGTCGISYIESGMQDTSDLDNYTLSLEIKKTAYPFVIGLIMAIKKSKKEIWISPKLIAKEIKSLRKKHLINEHYGNKTTKNQKQLLLAEKYYKQVLNIETTQDHPGFWDEAKKFISDNFPMAKINTNQHAGTTHYMISGIEKDDIIILL